MGAEPQGTDWLIVNPMSGSHDAAAVDAVVGALLRGGRPVTRLIRCPDDALPDAATLDAAGVERLAVFAGDGTINAAIQAARGWDGAVLVLPGGTMNLLSRALHGDAAAPAIALASTTAAAHRTAMPCVVCGEGEDAPRAMVGVIAGPTTEWNHIRESLRAADLGELTGKLPQVLGETLGGRRVALRSGSDPYPALFAAPGDTGLRVTGFRLDGAIDLFRHGFAWIGGDFRTGPHDDLGEHPAITIVPADAPADAGPPDHTGLLVDGEALTLPSPVTLRQAECDLAFIATAAAPETTAEAAA